MISALTFTVPWSFNATGVYEWSAFETIFKTSSLSYVNLTCLISEASTFLKVYDLNCAVFTFFDASANSIFASVFLFTVTAISFVSDPISSVNVVVPALFPVTSSFDPITSSSSSYCGMILASAILLSFTDTLSVSFSNPAGCTASVTVFPSFREIFSVLIRSLRTESGACAGKIILSNCSLWAIKSLKSVIFSSFSRLISFNLGKLLINDKSVSALLSEISIFSQFTAFFR